MTEVDNIHMPACMIKQVLIRAQLDGSNEASVIENLAYAVIGSAAAALSGNFLLDCCLSGILDRVWLLMESLQVI